VSPAVGQAVLDDVTRALRDSAADLSVSFIEVRPADVPRGLRESLVDLVLARSVPADDDVDSAELRPTPLVLLVPEDHRLASHGGPASLADVDGERLLTWSPSGTPYTDMLLDRIAAVGATVELVESRVTGGRAMPDVVDLGAIALTPRGSGGGDGTVVVELADDVTLPLRVLWLRGRLVPAVDRLRAALPA
jgi:DNA-binding transcriptional LysR family regulator